MYVRVCQCLSVCVCACVRAGVCVCVCVSYRASSALSAHRLMIRPSRQTIWSKESRLFPSGGFNSETHQRLNVGSQHCNTFCISTVEQKMQKFWATDTVAGSRVADVNAVQPHVDVVLHVTPLLIIVEHEAPVAPKVKPVFFPSSQYGALKKTLFWDKYSICMQGCSCYNIFSNGDGKDLRCWLMYLLCRWSQPLFTMAILEANLKKVTS